MKKKEKKRKSKYDGEGEKEEEEENVLERKLHKSYQNSKLKMLRSLKEIQSKLSNSIVQFFLFHSQ